MEVKLAPRPLGSMLGPFDSAHGPAPVTGFSEKETEGTAYFKTGAWRARMRPDEPIKPLAVRLSQGRRIREVVLVYMNVSALIIPAPVGCVEHIFWNVIEHLHESTASTATDVVAVDAPPMAVLSASA